MTTQADPLVSAFRSELQAPPPAPRVRTANAQREYDPSEDRAGASPDMGAPNGSPSRAKVTAPATDEDPVSAFRSELQSKAAPKVPKYQTAPPVPLSTRITSKIGDVYNQGLGLANKYVAQPVTEAAEGVNAALADIPKVITTPAQPGEGIHAAVKRGIRMAQDIATPLTAPFSTALAPLAPVFEPYEAAASNVVKSLSPGAKVKPEFKNKPLAEGLATPGAVTTGDENADALVDMVVPLGLYGGLDKAGEVPENPVKARLDQFAQELQAKQVQGNGPVQVATPEQVQDAGDVAENVAQPPPPPQQAAPAPKPKRARAPKTQAAAAQTPPEVPSGVNIVGPKEEALAAETPETLKAQVEALKDGTNDVVYIPKGQESEAPPLPEGMQETEIPGDQAGAGTYYHSPEITAPEIGEAVEKGDTSKLLGFEQSKEEASASPNPTTVVARDDKGTELKAAIVDGNDKKAIENQADKLKEQFPNAATVNLEHPDETVKARKQTNNSDLFKIEFKKQLQKAIKEHPKEYGPVANKPFEEVYKRMADAIDKRTISKEGRAFKETTKALGIPNTYSAFDAFMDERPEKAPEEPKVKWKTASIVPTRGGVIAIPHAEEETTPVPEHLRTEQKPGTEAKGEEIAGREESPAPPEHLRVGPPEVTTSEERIPKLIDKFEREMRSGTMPTDPKGIRERARETVGGDPAHYVDDIYDAIEGASNRIGREGKGTDLKENIERAARREEMLGNRTRSLEITKLQQFSTPHPIAEAAAYAGDVAKFERVLEPTAGTGNLVEPFMRDTERFKTRGTGYLSDGHNVDTIELDPRRTAVLRANGYKPHQGDYLKTPSTGAHVIVTNPPWGKISSGRYKALDVPAPWGKYNDVSERFVVKNMTDLPDGGRVSAVMPSTILDPASAGFRKWLNQQGTVRAMIESPPDAYRKRGTDVRSILLVVDKAKGIDQPPIMRVGSEAPKNWAEYADAVKPLGNGEEYARPISTATRESAEPARAAEPESNVPAVPSLGSENVPRPEVRATGDESQRLPVGGPDEGAGELRPERSGMGSVLVPEEHGFEPAGQQGETRLVRQSTGALRTDGMAPERRLQLEEAERSPVFAPYAIRSGIAGNPHPRQIVETKALAGAPSPEISYRPSEGVLDAHRRKIISDEQVDAVAAVGQAVSKGHAYLVADDVGVGKSREIAATIHDWMQTGKSKRILVTSASEVNLRDLQNEIKLVTAKPGEESPYKMVMLRDFPQSAERTQKKTPYQPIPQWDNAVYMVEATNLTPFARAISELQTDGLLADEVHKYKNIEGSKVGASWRALHNDWMQRKAPIAYFSATPGTNLEDLEYLYGLREWKPDGFGDWVALKTGALTETQIAERDAKAKRGKPTAAMIGGESTDASTVHPLARKRGPDVYHQKVSNAEMEQIMRELKMKGKYGARDLWRGGVEFGQIDKPLTVDEKGEWTKAVKFMRDAETAYYKYSNEDESIKKGFGPASQLQAAAKRKMFDVRLTRALDAAHEALGRGEQPVISVINVNPTEEGSGNIYAALASINVKKVLQDKETGEKIDLGEIPEAIAEKNSLLERAHDEFPPSPDPIKQITDRFGKENVAVITGAETPKERLQSMRQFQDGTKKVAVISGAGKTGINLHHVLETDGAEKGRRHLIIADYEWSATNFKQELGRVDRAGQISSPKVSMLTLGTAAENKFISTIANRMKTLGAVSKGAAESTGSTPLEQYELGGDLDNEVIRETWRHALDPEEKQWFRGQIFNNYEKDGTPSPRHVITNIGVKDFLLQLQLMPTDVGNSIWDKFWKTREELMTGEAVEKAMASKAQKLSGEVLRETQLRPDLTMYEVKDAAGHRSAILSGMITDKMHILRQFLPGEQDFSGEMRTKREYVNFTAKNGENIAGLRVQPSYIKQIGAAFDKALSVEHKPEEAVTDLKAGDKITLQNGWQLRMGSGGEKKGYVIIDGAKLSNTNRGQDVLRHGAKYNPVSGGFFYLPEDKVQQFLERYPIDQGGAKPARSGEAGFVTPGLLKDVATGSLYREAARKITDEGLRLGDKYNEVRKEDPKLANGLQQLDNAATYFKEKAQANIKKVVGGLSRDQERLFTLMADEDSRNNLRENHPDEYEKAQNDPKIQQALSAYKPLEQELTASRQARKGAILDRDYLRRVYEEHVAGVNKPNVPSKERLPEVPFDRVIRASTPDNAHRAATSEHFYQEGLHEFGPAYGTKYVAEKMASLKSGIANHFMERATPWRGGSEMPESIDYDGKEYFRPDIAQQMSQKRGFMSRGPQAPRYEVYDPGAGIHRLLIDKQEGTVTPTRGMTKYLGPEHVVNVLRDYDARNRQTSSGGLHTFFRQQILGFGFGVPHIANIERRVMQTFHGGVANPHAWAAAWRVAFDKDLKTRAIQGVNDPRYDELLRQGGISTGEISTYKTYRGGNLNPLNWARFGHDLIFKPGGIDQRARLYVADLVRSQRPNIGEASLAREINKQLGDYNRANWTERQKLLSKFMLFPGWDTSSIRWVLEHPVRTAVPPAFLTLLANQVVNKFGGNQTQDQYDIASVHIGDRSYSTGLARESLARAFYRPLLNFAQAKVQGESNARAAGEAGRGIGSVAAGLVGMFDPRISGIAALAANRKSFFSGKEIVGRNDDQTPGTVLPTVGLEKRAAFIARQFFPGINRAFDIDENLDPKAFVGGNLGVSNYRSDAASRLSRNAGDASRTFSVLSKMAKTDPHGALEYLHDPDNAVLALFHNDFAQLSTGLHKIDAAVETVKGSNLPDKDAKLKQLANVRTAVLQRADALDQALFKAKQKVRSRETWPPVPSAGQPIAQESTVPFHAPQ